MIVTEEAARKLWCPMARVPDSNGVEGAITATNRHAGEKKGRDGKPRILRGNAMCIASQCMWWQWNTAPEDVATLAERGYEGVTADGYCGAARRP